jgi:hypothetical protein
MDIIKSGSPDKTKPSVIRGRNAGFIWKKGLLREYLQI